MSETEDISMTPSSERSRSRSSSSVPSPKSTPSASPRKRSAYRDGTSQEKTEDGYEDESMSTAATTPALTRTGSASAYTIPVSHRSSFSSKSEPAGDTDAAGAVITPATPANVAVYAIEYVQGLLQERARKVLDIGRRRAKSSSTRDWISTAEVVVLDLGDRGLDFVQIVLRLWIERPVFAAFVTLQIGFAAVPVVVVMMNLVVVMSVVIVLAAITSAILISFAALALLGLLAASGILATGAWMFAAVGIVVLQRAIVLGTALFGGGEEVYEGEVKEGWVVE